MTPEFSHVPSFFVLQQIILMLHFWHNISQVQLHCSPLCTALIVLISGQSQAEQL